MTASPSFAHVPSRRCRSARAAPVRGPSRYRQFRHAWRNNADARLVTPGANAYKYNAFGQRAVQTVSGGGTHFLFSPEGLLLAEHGVTGTRVRDYIYLNGQPLAVVDSAGTVNYILNDQIGQPQKMLSPSGTVTWQRVSGIFGDTVTQLTGTTAANPQRFPGQQFDPATSLHYNYYRDYDPATGRYIETDPIGLDGGVNVYAYVDGNPLTGIDFNGLREGSPNNLARRRRIDTIAIGYTGSTAWCFTCVKDDFGVNVNKCNKFVFDVINEAGAPGRVRGRPPLAAEWADPSVRIPNWRALKPGELPKPGDVAAFKRDDGDDRFSGHTGIITGPNGNRSAHDTAVYYVPG